MSPARYSTAQRRAANVWTTIASGSRSADRALSHRVGLSAKHTVASPVDLLLPAGVKFADGSVSKLVDRSIVTRAAFCQIQVAPARYACIPAFFAQPATLKFP